MSPHQLTNALYRLVERLSVDDLVAIVRRLGQPLARPILEGVVRYQIWTAIDAAAGDRQALVAVANALLAVTLGWEGAPILTLEDVPL